MNYSEHQLRCGIHQFIQNLSCDGDETLRRMAHRFILNNRFGKLYRPACADKIHAWREFKYVFFGIGVSRLINSRIIEGHCLARWFIIAISWGPWTWAFGNDLYHGLKILQRFILIFKDVFILLFHFFSWRAKLFLMWLGRFKNFTLIFKFAKKVTFA